MTLIDLFLCILTLIFSGLVIFCSKRKHFLSTLLSLEYIVLGIFVIFLISLRYSYYFYSLIYLTFTACEGALGLSVLVVIGRTHGRDYFTSFNRLID